MCRRYVASAEEVRRVEKEKEKEKCDGVIEVVKVFLIDESMRSKLVGAIRD